MKTHFLKTTLALSLGSMLLPAAWAGPLQRSQVPADAAWCLHLDVEKLKTTEIGQFLLEEMDKPEAQHRFAVFQGLFNFDPRKTLKGCTLYSRGTTPEDAVLLLEGDFDLERLTTLAKMGKEYESSRHRDYTIHSWIDQRRQRARGAPVRTYGAIHTSGVVVLGQKAERVAEALDVLDRIEIRGAARRALPLPAKPGAAVVLIGVARPGSLGPLPPNVAFLRNFKTLTLTAGETGGDLAADLVVETENEEAAHNLVAVSQGLLAWTAFQGDKAAGNKLLRGLSTSQKDALVTLSLKMPAAEAIQMAKARSARRAARER